ncbi:MAG: phage major capsid protein [Solirubrobacterales bacterium]
MSKLTDLYEQRDRLQTELDGLGDQYRDTQDQGVLERMGNLKRGIVNAEREIVMEAANDPAHRESSEAAPATPERDTAPGGEDRDAALRAVEARSDEMESRASDRLADLIDRDKLGTESRYLRAVAEPAYLSAFMKQVSGGGGAEAMLNRDEQAAMQAVGAAMTERALQVGDGKFGGFAVPFTLDPTIMLTSAGAVNPLRELASVATIVGSEWKGISSAGVTAAFAKELTEVGDNTPELAQPTIKPERAHAFVPASIEVTMDWANLQAELQRLFADAKETLEATKFALGDGTDEPAGIVTGATEVVESAEAGKVGIADWYALQAALPPRFQANAHTLMALAVSNAAYRLVGGGSTEPSLFAEDRSTFLGKPWAELSTLDATIATGKNVAVYGDIAAGFKIVDRVGLTVEVIPHLFGENNRPIGARGFYAYWRTGSKVVNKAALRTLKVK